MRTALLALAFAVPVSLTADLIGMAFGAAEPEPCATPAKAVPEVLPPAASSDKQIKRPHRRWLRTA